MCRQLRRKQLGIFVRVPMTDLYRHISLTLVQPSEGCVLLNRVAGCAAGWSIWLEYLLQGCRSSRAVQRAQTTGRSVYASCRTASASRLC